jgi:hypothetical protein
MVYNIYKRGCAPEINLMGLLVGLSRVRESRNVRLLPPPANAGLTPFAHLRDLKSDNNFRIWFAGFNENSVGFYASSQAGIMLTSFKSESFPLTIVDCLFSERPFIATSVGEIRNMLTTDTGLAGEVIELENWKVPVNKVAEAIASLASSPAVYQAAKERACDAAKRYRIDIVVKQYLELIDRDVKRGVALDG